MILLVLLLVLLLALLKIIHTTRATFSGAHRNRLSDKCDRSVSSFDESIVHSVAAQFLVQQSSPCPVSNLSLDKDV